MTAETESIVQGCIDCFCLCLIRCNIKPRVNIRIRCLEVDCRGNEIVLHCKNAGNRLYRSGTAKQMTRHTLCT